MSKLLTPLFDFLSSVKLAVILIIVLAGVLAVGTFYEAEYGTPEAQRVIYKSWITSVLMLLLIINLAAAAIDRMPWKKNHVGFVVTHAGIIVLIVGSFITQKKGLDGTLAIAPGETSDYFIVPETEFHVYQNIDGRPFAVLLQEPVDFDSKHPKDFDYEFKLVDDEVIRVTDYMPRALRVINMEASEDPKSLPAVQFTIYNDNVKVQEWLGLDGKIPAFYNMGPALITFIKGKVLTPPQPSNQIVIAHDKGKLKVGIFSSKSLKPTLIDPKIGEEYPTGWMNLKFKIEAFHERSKPSLSYTPAKKEDSLGNPAIEVEIQGKRQWFEIGNPSEMKGAQNTYFVYFANKRYDLGFQIKLKEFKVGRYAGSVLPMTYESDVIVNDKVYNISMNEPLTMNGFTLYQSSFEQNERGEAVLSIFSVNHDPGRWIKYLGSIMIVGGIAIMFYWKPRYTRKRKTA